MSDDKLPPLRIGTAAQDATDERVCAHVKHAAKGNSAEQLPWTDPRWLPILVEEVGEVARALCDGEPPARVREELVQVAAMALAWADAIPTEDTGRVCLPTLGQDPNDCTAHDHARSWAAAP